MTRPSSLSAHALALILCSLNACAGTSTGNPIDGDDASAGKGGNGGGAGDGSLGTGNEGAYGRCDATEKKLATRDTQSALGFSADDLLAVVGSEHTLSMAWGGNGLVVSPSGQSTLHLTITPTDDAPRFIDLEPKTDDGGGNIGIELAAPPCNDVLEVSVQISVKSDDGGLDERFETTLRASDLRAITAFHNIKREDIEGSLTVSAPGSAAIGGDFELQAVTFSTTFSKLGVSGSLMPTLVSPGNGNGDGTSSGGVGTSGGAAARWPASNACDSSAAWGGLESAVGAPLAIDDAFGGGSLQGAIDAVNAAGALSIAWGDGDVSDLQLSFSTDAEQACARFALDENGNIGDEVHASVAGTLKAKSEDGRIDATWPMLLMAIVDADDQLRRATVLFDPNAGNYASLVSPAQFESKFGISGVDVSAYDQANASVTVSWPLGDGNGEINGTLTVHGANVPECAMPQPMPDPLPQAGNGGGSAPGGSAGCQGIDLVDVETAAISGK